MRYCLFTLLLIAVASELASAQSIASNYRPDLNGRLVEGSRLDVGPKGDKTELSDSMNGRKVPREVTETRVISEGPSGKVVETVTRKFDPTGQPGGVVKTVSEEQTHGNATTIRATTYVSDVNGRLQEGERRTVESVKQGTTTSSDVTIARPGPTGSFDTVEKRKVVSVADKDSVHEDETVYRPAQNAGLVPAEREVRDTKKETGGASQTTQVYRPDYTGRMELMTQEVAKTTEKPDGTTVIEKNVYGRATDGVDVTADTAQRVRAQEIIVRTKGAGDAVVETTTLRQTTPGDPTRLGEPRKVSETVCTGKCTGPLQP
jgi:hypothetical protein